MKKIVTKRSICELKKKVNLECIVSADIELQDRGDYSVGPSPFSDPNSEDPIFINKELNRFSCPASGCSGDVIEFVMRFHSLSFMEALKHLACIGGFELTYVEPTNSRFEPPAHPELEFRDGKGFAA